MKKYFLLLITIFTMSFFVGCDYGDDIESPNYFVFESSSTDVGVDINGNKSVDINVYSGNITGADRTIEVSVDTSSTLSSEAYTVPGSLTIPANSNEGVFTVDIADIDISATGETLILNLTPERGLSVGESITLNVVQVCPNPEFKISFSFDDWASETSWDVKDADGNILFEGGGYEDGDTSASKALCLTSNEYTFTVYDAYGDGLSDPEDGSVTLTYGGEEIAVISGNFGTEESVTFTLD